MTRSWVRRAMLVGAILGLGLLLTESSRRQSPQAPSTVRHCSAVPDEPDADPFLDTDPVEPGMLNKAAARPQKTLEVRLGSRPTVLANQDGLIRTGNELFTQEFRPEGVRVSDERGHLDFSLRDIRIGGKSLRSGGWLTDGKPAVEPGATEHVVYRRGAVTEKYSLLSQGVEQIFVLGSDLAALRHEGDLTVTVALDSPLKRVDKLRSRGAKNDSLEFTDAGGASVLQYGGATAIDADGRRQSLSYHIRGDELAMVLDAGFLSSARFPLTIDPPVVAVTPTLLTFSAPINGPNPAPQRVQLQNAGSGQLKWKATPSQPWIIVSPAQGARQSSMKKNVNVSINVAGLAAGEHDESITFQPKSGPGGTVVVTVKVFINDGPTILLNPTSLTFDSPGGVGTPNPLPQTVTVQNVGPGTLTWDASAGTTPAGGTWLSVIPIHGNLAPGATATLTVSVDHTGLADGTYTGAITVVNNSVPPRSPLQPDQIVNVTLNVSSTPIIVLSPAAGLTLDVPLTGGTGTAFQTMTVTNGGGGTLSWTASPVVTTPAAGTWLAVSPTTGSLGPGASATLTVTVTRGALVAGGYDGQINVTSGAASNSPQSIPITLNVDDSPTITLNPSSLTFTAAQGGTPPASQTVTLSNTGLGTLNWSSATLGGATWLAFSPTSGTLASGASTQLTITVNQGAMPASTLTEQIEISDPNATNPTEVIFVTLNIVDTPTIGLNPTSFSFSAPLNGTPPVSQTLTVTNIGSGTLAWTATVDPTAPWLTILPASGSLGTGVSATPSISVDQTGLAAGTYNASILIGCPAASNTPQTVVVTLVVNDTPTIGFSPASLTFNAPQGGAQPPSQTLNVSNQGSGSLVWTATATVPWITSIAPTGSTLSSGASLPVSVTVNQGALAAGSYTGAITITAAGATNTPQTVPVTLNVNNTPSIGLSPTSLSFTAPQGGAPPAPQQVTVSNTGTGTLNWVGTPSDPSWLSISASTGGLTPGAFEQPTVSVNQGSMAVGVYNGTIQISATGASNTPQTISVQLTVTAAATPTIGLSSASFTFNGPIGVVPPPSQPVTITNTGGGTLNWTATFSDPWISLTPPSGSSGAGLSTTPSISVDPTGLGGGAHNGTITITDVTASNSPVQISVTFNILVTPTIGLSSQNLVFSAFVGGSNPTQQTVTLTNTGTGTLTWTATPGAAWITVVPPASGSLASSAFTTLTIAVDISGLPAGGQSSSITVSAAGASNDPQIINVTLNLLVPNVVVAIPKAGYCGATGLEMLMPFALFWGYRRCRRNGWKRPVSPGRLGVFLAVLILGSAQAWAGEDDLPRSLQQEEPPPRPQAPVPPQPQGEGENPDMLDFSKSALDAHLGFVDFSSKFKGHARFCGGLQYRVPSPLLSNICDTDPERIGVFLDLSVSSIDRDIPSTDKSGTLLFVTLGTDAAFYKDEDWDFRGQVGIQYGYFGGVEGLKNGIAALVGLRGALNLGEGVWLVLNPQFAIAKQSNSIFFLNLGAEIKF